MKKRIFKIDKPLSLDKEIINRLNDEQLGALEGGLIAGSNSCNTGVMTVRTNSCDACSCNG